VKRTRLYHACSSLLIDLPKAERNADPSHVSDISMAGNRKYQTYEFILKALNLTSDKSQSILATAVIEVKNGPFCRKVRALLDSGSQKNFLTCKVAIELGLSKTNKVRHRESWHISCK